MSKRSSSDDSNCDSNLAEPKAKRRKNVEFEPVRICSISGVKDIDNKVLRAQYYKLCERFRYKEKLRQLLEKRVEELEGRQAKDDEVSCIINRYWNRLDEDVQLLLQRFDADANVDFEDDDEINDVKNNFLTVLSNWGLEEIDEKLGQRVEFTRRALSKLVQVFDKVTEKNLRIVALLSEEKETSHEIQSHNSLKENIDDKVKSYTVSVFNENTKLQQMITNFQAKNHRLKLQLAGDNDKTNVMENRVEVLTNNLEDVRYELEKALRRSEKLDFRLAEYIRKEQTLQVPIETEKKSNGVIEEIANVSITKLEELQQKLDSQTELAANRLIELQEITEKNKTFASELESCQMRLKYTPIDIIKSSPEYICLQSSYSALFDDCRALRHEIEELKQQLNAQRETHRKQLDLIKIEETAAQERMQETVLDLDNQLNQVRKEYDTLCVEFEQSNAANEQAGPINEQVLALMNTFSTQNAQLKLDVSRYKRRWTEVANNLAKCQKELGLERKINDDNYLIVKLDDDDANSVPEIISPDHHSTQSNNNGRNDVSGYKSGIIDHKFHDVTPLNGEKATHDINNYAQQQDASISSQSVNNKTPKLEADSMDDIKPSCSANSYEYRLKLERDKAVEKLQEFVKSERKEKFNFFSDEAKRKIQSLSDQCEKLRKELANAKQEEDGLMAELDSTGQACDEMQEQNQKLVHQLREKDEANLKLMAERIRTNQLLKKMKEEKETLDANFTALDNLMAAKTLLVKKMEEKERALMENRSTLEQELRFRDQANDSLKRKTAESTQSTNDMRIRLDKLSSQFSEVQESVAKKASSYEVVVMKSKRLEEEKSSIKRKLERAKRMEKFDNADEVLKEENRLLKESLTCPSCKVNTKNAILTKCYHVFCFNCLKLRYDTRRRKCPKCNAAFGANDFRRVYIE